MEMNKLDHPLALYFHEFVVVGSTLDGVLGHQLVLRFVRAQRCLAHSQDRLVEVIHGVKLDHQLVFFKDRLLLGSAEALSTPWFCLGRFEKRVGRLSQSILFSNHLTLIQKCDIFKIVLNLFVEAVLRRAKKLLKFILPAHQGKHAVQEVIAAE